ncbi:MAG: type IV pilus assembly protein PilM [Planctomycetota bacterium]|nr:MAG: type IV pilus assembly protein PilM [Planctomycetota bacterium]
MARAAWGIDIGQSALKAVKLQYVESTGQVMAAAFDYIQYPKILSQPDAVPEEIIQEAMKTLLSRNDLAGENVAISVPGQTSLTRFIQLPPVEGKRVHQIVQYEARQQIPFALEDVVWSYQRLGSGIEEGGFLLDAEVGLFAMKRDQLAQCMRPYVQNKVELELIQIAPLALYNVLCYDEFGQRPGVDVEADFTIILDMGCDNTTLLVSNAKKIWVRNVPIGGNHFTRALAKDMKLSFAKAELLKCNATKSEDPRAVFQALRPVFNDFVSEIQRSIGFFSSVNRQAKIGKVIGLGNGFKLAGLQKFLQQNLQYDVERPDMYKALAGDTVINSPLFADNVLSFAVPYGLALQAIDQTFIKTTLLPPEITRERIIRRKKPWALATAATLLIGTSLATIGNAIPYSKVHTEEFKKAEDASKAFSATVSGLAGTYGTEKTRNETARANLLAAVQGRRGMEWMKAYLAINDCLPRDDDGADISDITQRKQMTLDEISAKKVADLDAEWFATLVDSQKQMIVKEEQEVAPAGAGYVFTIRGQHWHNDKVDPKFRGRSYVNNTFLNNLKQMTIQHEGFPVRDVRRMGLTHATLIDSLTKKIAYNPNGQKIEKGTRTRLPGVANPLNPGASSFPGGTSENFIEPGSESFTGGEYPGTETGFPNSSAGGLPPKGDKDTQIIEVTSFIVQLAYRPDLPPPEEEVPADGVTAEGEAASGAATEAAVPADATTPPVEPATP